MTERSAKDMDCLEVERLGAEKVTEEDVVFGLACSAFYGVL